ncbi:hypothetical protein CC1G_10133 [Coprinopsis cinerea okayama7|uniref:Uncharacterized protein n=1 Tax=Coprinopsis cinerea (strain Okayama-7 / 130 / ATCC MYA-4618 / FGSC 9003) TaxID=240176 RepID=A8N3Z4_COPC7|nr:hypothetical protein CC1G_10133 [Coprinopsis cinerea okayama7\|eukprot:XP_001829603.2 hypothetical protein CC1G_10133 [Coprinopsis cinerea okayama7\
MRRKLRGDGRAAIDPDIPLRLQVECEHIAEVASRGLNNADSVGWCVQTWFSKNRKRGAHWPDSYITRAFPPSGGIDQEGNPNLRTVPCVVTDSKGRILTWYLPGIITEDRQRQIDEAIQWLASQDAGLSMRARGSFRDGQQYFSNSGQGPRAGVATYASAWPMQGHPNGPFSPSTNFKDEKKGGLEFIKRLTESTAVLGAVLAVIHPILFEAGLDSFKKFSDIGRHPSARYLLLSTGAQISTGMFVARPTSTICSTPEVAIDTGSSTYEE